MAATDTGDWQSRAGSISKRNGAWMIAVQDPESSSTPDDEFDCASSQAEARRIARSMAEGWGFGGPWRWVDETGDGCQFWLFGNPPSDDDDEDDEA